MKVAVVIPALHEATTIGATVRGVLAGTSDVDGVIVVDGGSRDDTVEQAEDAGAQLVVERRRGYGRACKTGVDHASRSGADVIVFIDGGGAEAPGDLPAVLAPIADGRADLVVGSRVLGDREFGALRPRQRIGNALATALIRLE